MGDAVGSTFMVVFLALSMQVELAVPQTGSITTSTARSVEFAPGVRIDWAARLVEVRAKVVLRRGPLELLACSPQTREHESVLVVAARPLHIFQALGLLGAKAGHPPTYDQKTQAVIPPTGAAVAVSVRFGEGRKARELPARELLRVVDGGEPTRLRWVYSGSRRLPGGEFAADVEGTVACVVDFDSAVLSLDRSHSANNDQLWLSANTPHIPPVGTACLLLIRVGDSEEIVISLDGKGRLRDDATVLTPGQVAKKLAARNPNAVIRLVAFRNPPPAEGVRTAIQALVAAGVDRGRIETSLKVAEGP